MGWDERVNGFLDRPLKDEWPCLWPDATYLKVREGGRIISVAAIIAVAVSTEGKREIVGLGPGPSEAETPDRGPGQAVLVRILEDPTQAWPRPPPPAGGVPCGDRIKGLLALDGSSW